MQSKRTPSFDGRMAGRQINRDMGRDFAVDLVQQLTGDRENAPIHFRRLLGEGRLPAAILDGKEIGE